MSPEQIQGVAAPDARSDLYSVGVSLYELVTGKKPFDGDSQFAIMSAHLAGTPVPPVTVDPRLPKLLNDVILMSVAKDAGARFQTAAALRNALSNVAAGMQPTAALPPPVPAPSPAKAAPQPAKAAVPGKPVSHRGAWMGLGAVVAVLAIVAVIALAPWKKTGAAPAKADAPVAQPAPQATPQQPVSEPAAPGPGQPEPQLQQPAAPVSTPVNASPRVPSRTPGAAKSAPAGQAQQPAEQQPAPQHAVQEQPVQHQPAAPAGPSRAELQEVRESIALIGVRASGIRTSLQSLQRSQAASGLNLRGDMQAAANLMTTYLDGAEAALNAGDVAQARSFLDKAEPQVQKLEKFLNR
jgi:serine/threonine-protein kinase